MSHHMSARWRRLCVLVTACVLAALLALAAPAPGAAAAHPAQSTTQGLPTVTPLSVLSCASSRSCWALDGIGTVAAHWDGTQWTSMPLSFSEVTVHALTCLSDHDCWAVGFKDGVAVNLIVHWNGISWSAVPAPNPKPYLIHAPRGILELNAVACPSRVDCWAAGDYRANGTSNHGHWFNQILHWNGIAWSQVSAPQPGRQSAGASTLQLGSLACAGSRACWAAGQYATLSGTQVPSHALLLGWDGARWSTVRIPRPPGAANVTLTSLACPTTARCIAVGGWGAAYPTTEVWALLWNGTGWTRVRSAALRALQAPGQAAGLSASSVNCDSASDCWVLANWYAGGA